MHSREIRIQAVLAGMTLCACLMVAETASAQPPLVPATPQGDAAQPQGGPQVQPAPGPAVGAYPPDPNGFVRGNRMTGQKGNYFSFWKLLPIILLFLYWTNTSNWVNQDSTSLKVRSEFWNSLTLLFGVLGFVLILTVPMYLVGLLCLLCCHGVPLGLYIQERNSRVPDSAKVLTREHIRKWTIRQLARIGIHIGGEAQLDSTGGPPIRFVGKTRTGQRDEGRSRQVETSKGYMAAKELVYDAILRRATDIHLEPKEDELSVRLRIDGVMYPTEPFDKAVGDSVVNIIKVLCAMDITERRRPQDGSFGALLETREIDFRVASQGTRHGEKVSLRILDQANSVSTLEQLGMRKQMQQQIENIIKQPHGMFVSCGPTGAGKSTTLYASLSSLDHSELNIITIEDPVEYKMNDVTQIEINTKAGQTFAQSLRSVLRQDPDVVMIGEIRDEETAKIACQAATTGHMVFSTVHANDTITALYRLLDLGVEPFMVAGSISAILGQRLARRLCAHCKEAYRPNPDFLKKAGLPTEKIENFYRPPQNRKEVCTHCAGLGFRGRIGVYELLIINDRIRDMIRDKAAMSAIKDEARKGGMLYMHEEGLRLVVRGVTSVEEMLRVVKAG